MKIKEIMTSDVEVVRPDDNLQTAAEKMRRRDVGFLPVCDGQRLVGTLSDRDLAVRGVADGLDPKSTPVKELATSNVVWCFEDDTIADAAKKMQTGQIRRLMVIRRGDKKLVGVVSLGDLAAGGTVKASSDVLRSTSPQAE